MLRQKQKIANLLDELLHYVLQTEPSKVVIEIEDLEERVQITVQDVGPKRSARECRQAEALLNAPRRNELKDYYSGLAGEESCGPCNLHLVGMMVDGGRIEATETGTRLAVWWAPE
jgi:phenylpyruvate tautomerase PptA (4-oxalocrotonate tautomerase family)